MNKIVINPHDCSREEFAELKEYLEENSWDTKEVDQNEEQVVIIKPDEATAILSLINYVIGKRINDKACDLGYTGLLELKNKLYKE